MKATKKSPSAKVNAMTAPASLQLTAQTTIDLDAAAHDETGHALPRFRMVAYTGSPMRVGGWRYPVIIDLAGLVIPSQSRPIRFGHDPATSALDVHCRAHDVDNLYVVDGSFFPSSGAVNPALTIMANALRVGDHLIERLGAATRTEARHVSA